MKARSRSARRHVLRLRGLTSIDNDHIIRVLYVGVDEYACENVDHAQDQDGVRHSGISTNYSITSIVLYAK